MAPFSYVFDLTGEVNHDRGEVVCRVFPRLSPIVHHITF